MSHRLQITLEDAQYERLRGESDRTGASIAELVRRAIDDRVSTHDTAARLRALDESFGAWATGDTDEAVPSGREYVDRLRRGSRRQ